MVNAFVTDTHSLIWYLTKDSRLSNVARKTFQLVDESRGRAFIPCIVFVEILYLIEKKKIEVDFDSFIAKVSSSQNYTVEPLCMPVVENIRRISRKDVKDPSDRIIAATSIHLKLPLITRDRKLRKIGLDVVW